MPTIAITNQKGGVGKTTIAFNLAKGLAGRGYRTLVVDNDPQGNLTSAFLQDPQLLSANVLDFYEQDHPHVIPQPVGEQLDLIGATLRLSLIADRNFEVIFRLREGLTPVRDQYDVILIDSVPSFGYLNTAVLNTADRVLIPTKPAPFALEGLKDLLETIGKIRDRLNPELQVLGLVFNLVEGRQTTIGAELEALLRETYRELVFPMTIHKAIKLEESPSFGQSIIEYDPRGKSAGQFHDVIDELVKRLGI